MHDYYYLFKKHLVHFYGKRDELKLFTFKDIKEICFYRCFVKHITQSKKYHIKCVHFISRDLKHNK